MKGWIRARREPGAAAHPAPARALGSDASATGISDSLQKGGTIAYSRSRFQIRTQHIPSWLIIVIEKIVAEKLNLSEKSVDIFLEKIRKCNNYPILHCRTASVCFIFSDVTTSNIGTFSPLKSVTVQNPEFYSWWEEGRDKSLGNSKLQAKRMVSICVRIKGKSAKQLDPCG